MNLKEKLLHATAVSLIVVTIILAAHAQQVIVNPDMEGCAGDRNPLTSWNGIYSTSRPYPLSISSTLHLTFLNDQGTGVCSAFWFAPSTPYTQNLELEDSQTPGRFDFETYFLCITVSSTGTCTFILKIDDVTIPLTGTTTIAGTSTTGTFQRLSATGILIENQNAVVSLFCDTEGNGVGCAVTRATLTFDGSILGDPHLRGWNGKIFDIVGEAGSVFNLISDSDLQVNAFLNLQRTGPHSFVPGPVMMIVSFLTPNHTIIANAGGNFKDDTGFVTVDGIIVRDGEKIVFEEEGLSISFQTVDLKAKDLGMDSQDHFAATSHIEIKDAFSFTVFFVENHFNPAHPDRESISTYFRRFIDVQSTLLDITRNPHGLLGQTAHERPQDKGRSLQDWKIEGSESDYRVNDGILGSEFTFNKFVV